MGADQAGVARPWPGDCREANVARLNLSVGRGNHVLRLASLLCPHEDWGLLFPCDGGQGKACILKEKL